MAVTHHGLFHGVHVVAHDIRIAFDAINHSGGGWLIYPLIGLLIFAIVKIIRNRGGGMYEGTGGSSHHMSPRN
jgi:hypothetical protein